MQKKKVRARRMEHFRHGSRARQQAADWGARIIFRILISAERCYIILMRGTHSPMCNSMSTWPVIKRRAHSLALISDNGSGRRRRESTPRKKDFSLWTNLVLACVCVDDIILIQNVFAGNVPPVRERMCVYLVRRAP